MNDHAPETRHPANIQLRLWPAVVLAIMHAAALTFALVFSHTIMQFMVGGALIPLIVLVGFIIWWMLCRKIPLKQRFAGVALLILTLAWIIFTHPMLTGGIPFLIIVLPIITIGTVAILAATPNQPWPRRRAALVTLMTGTAILLTAIRVDGTNGDETPIMSWRWQPSSEELAQASFSAEEPINKMANVSVQIGPNDWPSFRGPQCDGSAPGITFATDWTGNPPKELWRRPIGIGWSSFTVIGDYFFTQEQRGEDELVVCYETNTGNQVWTNHMTGRFDEAHGGGPRATPTFHAGKLYVLGALGTLQCLDAPTGETVWKRELTEDANAKVPTWGFASSPLIVDGLVVVFAGGPDEKSVLAYSIESGDPVWQAGVGTHGYSSVHLANIDEVPQLLIPSSFGIQSFTPDTGKLLWQHEWRTFADSPRCTQPLLLPPCDIMLATEDQGMRRMEIRKTDSDWTIEEKWTARKFRPAFNDIVYHEGFAYGFDGRKLVCFDTANGERRWKSKRYGGQVLLLPDMNTLLLLSDKGEVILIEATPESHNEITRFKAIDGKTWNHPVIANGKLFVRNSQEAACYQLPAWITS